MNSGRASFLSGVILGLAAGIPVGYFPVWHSPASEPSTPESPLPSMINLGPSVETSFDLGDPSAGLAPMFESPEAVTLPDDSPLKNAIAVNTSSPPASLPLYEEPPVMMTQTAGVEPQPLNVSEAEPIRDLDSSSAASIRSLIERELSDISEGQREIWFDSLKDLSEQDVQGVLRMWKLFGAPMSDSPDPGRPSVNMTPHDDAVRTLPEMHAEMHDLPQPAATRSKPSVRNAFTGLVQQAIDVHRHNIAMAAVPGYRRIAPILGDGHIGGQFGLTSFRTCHDFTPGASRQTGNELDLLIDGSGFFVIQDRDGERYYTRAGGFHLSAERTVALGALGREFELTPRISIPDEVTRVSVQKDGHVQAWFADGQEEELGRIVLARFLNPAQLEYEGEGLFSNPRLESRPIMSAGDEWDFAAIQQGAVELSNVNLAGEESSLRRLSDLVDGAAHGTLTP